MDAPPPTSCSNTSSHQAQHSNNEGVAAPGASQHHATTSDSSSFLMTVNNGGAMGCAQQLPLYHHPHHHHPHHDDHDEDDDEYGDHDDDYLYEDVTSNSHTTINKDTAAIISNNVQPMDIVCGRGSRVAHPGNQRFRKIVLDYKEAYQKAQRRDDKTRITQEIVEALRSGPEPSR
jgi:hypothetical protein